MTTTVLNYWESEFRVGRRHASFDGSASVPTVGTMDDGVAQCYFRVVEGGFIVHRVHNVLKFQWLGLDAQQVKMIAVDRDGNFGEWETYTYSVLPNTSADWVRYISNSGNDTTGDGSVGNPWATATKAATEFASAVGANQVGAVFVEDDDTWAHTAQLLNTGNSIRRLLRFVRRGNGTARPKFTFSDGQNGFTLGNRGALHIDGVDIEGAHTTDVGVAFNLGRNSGGPADQSPWDLMVVDSDVTSFGMICYLSNNVGGGGTVTWSDRDTGCYDFVAFQNGNYTNTRSYHFYGFFYANEVLARDIYFGPHAAPFISGAVRIWSLGRVYFEDCLVNTGGGGSVRLLVNNNNAGGSFRCGTFVNLHIQYQAAGTLTIGPDPGATGVHYIDDIRFVGCRSEGWTFISLLGDASGGNGLNVARLDLINCVGSNCTLLVVTGSSSVSHTYSKVRVRNCVASGASNGFVYIPCAASRLADDCYTFVGNVKIAGTGNTGPLFFDGGLGISQADLAAKIELSDYNQTIKGDANSLAWGYVTGGLTLATWQSTYGHDLNSKQTFNSTGNIVDNGIADRTAGDFHLLSASGPIYQAGYPRPLGVGITADGYLRSATTPDAGPYEYGASTLPDDPPLDAPTPGPRSTLRFGLRLGF